MIAAVAEKHGETVDFYTTAADAIPNVGDAEVIYGFGTKLPEAAPNLKWFCTSSAGIDIYPKSPAFAGKDVLFSNSSGSFGLPIAEYIIMMSLFMMRKMPEYQEIINKREWTTSYKPIKTLFGSKIMVLGTGDLGTVFAKRVRSFEPELLIGVSKSGRPNESFDQVFSMDELKASLDPGDKSSELSSIISEIDLLVMCLPGAPGTENILNDAFINKLPNTAYVINVGRGSAVDEDAIIAALNEGRLAGATLDVFKTEPLPNDNPLWTTPGLLVTPHISGQEANPWTIMNNAAMFAEDLDNYLSGRPLAHSADLIRGY